MMQPKIECAYELRGDNCSLVVCNVILKLHWHLPVLDGTPALQLPKKQ